MAGIDETREFLPLRIAVMTVSDTRDEASDTSGKILVDRAEAAGHEVVLKRIVKDDRATIAAQLRDWAAADNVEVILTTGGTGLTGRDVTPEAVTDVCQKMIPGFGELFRALSFETIGVSTMQSRACAGVCDGTYVFALPGSNGACKDGWDQILSLQLDSRYRPCNVAGLIPRLQER